jgi:hypothetical protein
VFDVRSEMHEMQQANGRVKSTCHVTSGATLGTGAGGLADRALPGCLWALPGWLVGEPPCL